MSEEKTPQIEIIKEHDPEEGMTDAELLRLKARQLSEYRAQERRRREVDGEDRNNLHGPFWCLLSRTSIGLKLETIDTMPHGIPQLVVYGNNEDMVRALMHQRYAAYLSEWRIVPTMMDALREGGRAKFVFVNS